MFDEFEASVRLDVEFSPEKVLKITRSFTELSGNM